MIQIEHSATVPYSAEAMYTLVNDIKSYPEFIPACSQADIQEATENQITAKIL